MQNKKKYYLEYVATFTIAFVVLFYFCYEYWFYKTNKTFIRFIDGLDQHYIMFVYIGSLLRDFFRGFFVHHELSFPLWNMGIGYGSDVLTPWRLICQILLIGFLYSSRGSVLNLVIAS